MILSSRYSFLQHILQKKVTGSFILAQTYLCVVSRGGDIATMTGPVDIFAMLFQPLASGGDKEVTYGCLVHA